MNIDINYLKGLVDTTADFYQTMNGSIDKDKYVEIFYENILDSKTKTIIVGVKIQFVYITEFRRGFDDNQTDEKNILIYSKDKLTNVISDISFLLTEIDSQIIIK